MTMALVFGFAACDSDGDDDDGGNTKGELTITGLPEFAVQAYALVQGQVGETTVEGFAATPSLSETGITYKLVKVTGSQVVVPLYAVNQEEFTYAAFEGSGTGNGIINIFNTETVAMSSDEDADTPEPLYSKTFSSLTFTNGSATVAWSSLASAQ